MKKLALITLLLAAFIGCDDEESPTTPGESTTTEADLYAMGKDPTGFVFYKNSADTIVKAGGSGHPDPKLRTRYNAVAARSLDTSGKVKAGTVFPDSSLIVKELFTNDVLTTYVFMLKRPGDKNADANGWVWAETYASGSTLYAASNKGFGCINCHSTGIDYTRMNDTHP
ncbi:MAG: hypothetical protein ACYC09_01540 [Bacteroidota bacterium]